MYTPTLYIMINYSFPIADFMHVCASGAYQSQNARAMGPHHMLALKGLPAAALENKPRKYAIAVIMT